MYSFLTTKLKTIFQKWLLILLIIVSTISLESVCWGFTCHNGTVGGLTVEFSKIDPITVEGEVYSFQLAFQNSSDANIVVKARFSSIESVYLYDKEGTEIAPNNVLEETYEIARHSNLQTSLSFSVRNAFIDAHYPICAIFSFDSNGKTELLELHPVFATKLTTLLERQESIKPLILEEKSSLKLTNPSIKEYVPYWKNDGQELHFLPVGWSGQVEDSKAFFNYCEIARSGVQRPSWSLHPPYGQGPGVVGTRFVVQLPQSEVISLCFYRAMRDVVPPEPPTDGTCARVYATICSDDSANSSTLNDFLFSDPMEGALLFEKECGEVDWKKYEVDLSKYAGKTIVLTFETDPGAQRDTTCDQSFWGDVVLLADPQEVPLVSKEERELLRIENEKFFKEYANSSPAFVPSSGKLLSSNSRGFNLGEGQYAVVTLGLNGICDGWITLGCLEKYVQIDGVRVRYQGTNVGFDTPLKPCVVNAYFVEAADLEKKARQFARAHHNDIIGDIPVDAQYDERELYQNIDDSDTNELCCFIAKTTAGLAFRFVASTNAEIESLQFGSFSSVASRIYFGHGICVVAPKAFVQEGDGFGCASSHVGFDFENGVSVLEATTRPVLEFVVDPEKRIYTLSTSPDSRLTLLSSIKGAMDCAIKYAPGFDKAPAPLVAKKAGRFVFDYWGGTYAQVLDRIKTFVKYGLTDSLLIQHVWQCYGYDVRLPDVWPPRSEQGTLEELKQTQDFCDSMGIPFGLHDNYIDFYPDAEGFNYDNIILNADGQPQKAWYNPGPDVQSYRFNPNMIFPFAERNLNLIRKELMQTAYFTDVFSSIHIMDFYDRSGHFHPRSETLDAWNRYFDLVREKFNGNAITISESGNDALIGHLEGADAILRRITSEQENYSTVIQCEDSEYVPWFDAVNHKRFILHGVGYSNRYQGGLSRALRGIDSDDYLSSEVLTGHALMTDRESTLRDTIRKYWLLQSFARSLALDEITNFEFVDNDIHRQRIVWKSGAVVYINRGIEDWRLEGQILPNSDNTVVLPRFGFWTVNQDKNSCGGVIRLDGQIVEFRLDKDSFFVNGRQKIANQAVGIKPILENVEIADNSSLKGNLIWEATESTDKPYTPFLHLERPQTWWNDKPELNVLPLPNVTKTSDKWVGREEEIFGSRVIINIPEDIQPGFYNLLCGLYDTQTGKRLPLLGLGTGDMRYRIGSIVIEGRGEERRLRFKPIESLYDVDLRLAPNKKITDFGLCKTKGAFRAEFSKDKIVVIPLPEEPAFEVSLKTPFFCDGNYNVVERDIEGNLLQHSIKSFVNGALTFNVDASQVYSYEITKCE